MMEKHDKLDIADQMLDAAITEFLDHGRYFSALNLAAVAEELYGKAVRIGQNKNALDENIEAAQILLKEKAGGEITFKEWKQVANYYKNSIKHFDSSSESYVEIDPQNEARLAIADALINHNTLQRKDTSNVRRFNKWATEFVKQSV